VRKFHKLLLGFLIFGFVFVTFFSFSTNYTYNQEKTEEAYLSDVQKLLKAPANNVYFLYDENATPDLISAQNVLDICENGQQIEYFYSPNSGLVDSDGRPAPDSIGRGKYIVLFGGPFSQDSVKYYEDTKQSPVIFRQNSTYVWWETKKEEVIEESVTSQFEFDEHHDLFLMEYFIDDYGRGVFISYGHNWRGTWAAGLYFREVVYPKISEYKKTYYIFRWIDTNNDGFPQVNEIVEKRPQYVSIQAILHCYVNSTILQWFADAVHSRGLKVTWYVNPTGLDEETVSLLKRYISLGDNVQLSFGFIFFNSMKPEERIQHVNNYISAFKHIFNYYPTLVESYYIDAYTLNYISLRFPFVKGCIAYVNHEIYTDGFRSAGAYYMPYYPSKYNTIVPGNGQDKIDIVVLPFISRDIANSIMHQSVLFNLDPQDGCVVISDWRSYFKNLFSAYIEGWDQFGLSLYLIDLSFAIIPKGVIEKDLDFIKVQVESKKCSDISTPEFVDWFRSRFEESPSYRWIYTDPLSGSFSFRWYFTPMSRTGYVDGKILEVRAYTRNKYEKCYDIALYPYDNSAPQG